MIVGWGWGSLLQFFWLLLLLWVSLGVGVYGWLFLGVFVFDVGFGLLCQRATHILLIRTILLLLLPFFLLFLPYQPLNQQHPIRKLITLIILSLFLSFSLHLPFPHPRMRLPTRHQHNSLQSETTLCIHLLQDILFIPKNDALLR